MIPLNTEPVIKLIESPKLSALVRILCILVVLLVVFWAGTAVGYRKVGEPGGHGITGRVIRVEFPIFVVTDRYGREKTVVLNQQTTLRRARLAVASTSVSANDVVIVIGNPEGPGRMSAKLVRFTGTHATSSPGNF